MNDFYFSCLGREFTFYGVNSFRFRLDDRIFMVLSSWRGSTNRFVDIVNIGPAEPDSRAVPTARVLVLQEVVAPELFVLKDVVDDHIWLRFGDIKFGKSPPEFCFCSYGKVERAHKRIIQPSSFDYYFTERD